MQSYTCAKCSCKFTLMSWETVRACPECKTALPEVVRAAREERRLERAVLGERTATPEDMACSTAAQAKEFMDGVKSKEVELMQAEIEQATQLVAQGVPVKFDAAKIRATMGLEPPKDEGVAAYETYPTPLCDWEIDISKQKASIDVLVPSDGGEDQQTVGYADNFRVQVGRTFADLHIPASYIKTASIKSAEVWRPDNTITSVTLLGPKPKDPHKQSLETERDCQVAIQNLIVEGYDVGEGALRTMMRMGPATRAEYIDYIKTRHRKKSAS
jgi:hypothetical protein